MTEESFESFKNSFSYGSRTDLNFKFLKSLSNEASAQFFQELLWKLGDALDDGNYDRLVEHVYEWQKQGYEGATQWAYDSGPFAKLQKPLSETKIGLLTSTGHFVEGDDPEPFGVVNMSQEEAIDRISEFVKAKPELSAIPMETPHEQLRARHGGYDIRGVEVDSNVALPLERLRELTSEGIIGELAANAYSFVGATSQMRLLKQAGPAWVELFQKEQIEAAILIPV
ncbi:MAG: glycine/sarcosine/betaine reductase selenoprotein B family protein [Chloroflexota bacterium]